MSKKEEIIENDVQPVAEAPKPERQSTLVINTEAGEVRITQNVVAQIVKKNVLSIEGVARFAPKGLVDIRNFFSDRSYDSSMNIDFVDNQVDITVALILYFGCKVQEVSAAVKTAIKQNVEEFTGAPVVGVKVLVKDLIDPEEPEIEVEEEPEAEQ